MLIASCLLLVVLTVTLWGKWVENRERADRLSAELKKVYVEAEKLRTEAAAAKQRITQLERQLRRAPRAPGPRAALALVRSHTSSSRAFCSAVPTAMRRCPGKPTPAPSRTRMPGLEERGRAAPPPARPPGPG